MNSLETLPEWNKFMKEPVSAWLGFINAIYWIAFAASCPFSAWAANRFGRKAPIYFGYMPLILGLILETTAPNPTVFIIGRTFLGIPSAAWTSAAPLLVTECAHPQWRGILSALYFCGYYVGASIAAWSAFGTRNYGDSWSWRIVCLLQISCPIGALPGLFLCPESPHWLLYNMKPEQARKTIAEIHSADATDSPCVDNEIKRIQDTLQEEKLAEGQNGYLEMLSTPANRRRLLITISLGIFSQWVGNGVVSFYLSAVLNSVGISTVTDQTLISGCLQIWNIGLAILGASLVEKVGRRPLFLTSFAIMFASYIIILVCSAEFAQSGEKSVGIVVVPFLFIFFAGYDIAM